MSNLGSSSATGRCRRWVERGWPITWHARRSETRFDPSVLRTCSTASRRLAGLSSFPIWLPSISSYPRPCQQPVSSSEHSHVQALSIVWLDRFASRRFLVAIYITSAPISLSSGNLPNRLTFRRFYLGDPKLRNNLLCCMTFSSHCVSPFKNPISNKILSSALDSFSGGWSFAGDVCSALLDSVDYALVPKLPLFAGSILSGTTTRSLCLALKQKLAQYQYLGIFARYSKPTIN